MAAQERLRLDATDKAMKGLLKTFEIDQFKLPFRILCAEMLEDDIVYVMASIPLCDAVLSDIEVIEWGLEAKDDYHHFFEFLVCSNVYRGLLNIQKDVFKENGKFLP